MQVNITDGLKRARLAKINKYIFFKGIKTKEPFYDWLVQMCEGWIYFLFSHRGQSVPVILGECLAVTRWSQKQSSSNRDLQLWLQDRNILGVFFLVESGKKWKQQMNRTVKTNS